MRPANERRPPVHRRVAFNPAIAFASGAAPFPANALATREARARLYLERSDMVVSGPSSRITTCTVSRLWRQTKSGAPRIAAQDPGLTTGTEALSSGRWSQACADTLTELR